MTAANSVRPTANPFVGATEPLDRVTWSLLMTALPFPERIPTYKTKPTPMAHPRSGSKDPKSSRVSTRFPQSHGIGPQRHNTIGLERKPSVNDPVVPFGM